MKKIFPKKQSGGYGPKKSFGSDRAAMHRATCNKCGASCEVPFKPNGKKPIYCSDCFRKEDGGADRQPSYDKPRYVSTPRAGNDDISKQLKALNEKMDAILSVLTDLGDEESDDDASEEGEA